MILLTNPPNTMTPCSNMLERYTSFRERAHCSVTPQAPIMVSGFALKLPQEVARALFIQMNAPVVHRRDKKRKGSGYGQFFQRISFLMRLRGVGSDGATLLEEAGVTGCKDLQHRNPEHLHTTLIEWRKSGMAASPIPSLDQVTQWIAEAKAMATLAQRER